MTDSILRPADSPPARLVLTRNLTRSLKRGHPWVFADALQHRPSGEPGAQALLVDRRGRPLARGYCDPGSALSFRCCSTERREALDDDWARRRIDAAIALRKAVIDGENTTGYRLINGEGDAAPGLVCDVYGDTAVIRLDGPAAAGFWSARGVAAHVVERLGLRCAYERERTRGGAAGGPLIGDTPAEPVPFVENGLRFTADVVAGQKTGFFLDQRDNRQLVRQLSAGRRVLNVFGYTGGFSVYAAAGGAEHVTTVDLAAPALAMTEGHLALNGLDVSQHESVASDAFDFLATAEDDNKTWDLVVLDPPSFAPNKQAAERAGKAYERLIGAGARVTTRGGLLVAASCSSHVSLQTFIQHCEEGVSAARRTAAVLDVRGQPADHPAPLPLPELRYLKLVLMRVS